MALDSPRASRSIALAGSAARTADGNGGTIAVNAWETGYVFELDVTAAQTDATDTLDCFIQVMIDDANWIDVVHFTQVLGNGGAKRHVAKVVAGGALSTFEVASALAAGAERAILSDKLRARWVIVGGVGDGSFTFSVWGYPI